jgi:hypothetical protein
MKSFLLLCVPAAAMLAGCAYYPGPYGYPAQGYYGGAPAAAYGGYGYGAPSVNIGVYGSGPDGRHWGDGGERHWNRDRDGDGVPDRRDARPDNPRRR